MKLFCVLAPLLSTLIDTAETRLSGSAPYEQKRQLIECYFILHTLQLWIITIRSSIM